MKSILLKCFGIVHEGHGPGLPGMLKACSLALLGRQSPHLFPADPPQSLKVEQNHTCSCKKTPVVKRSPVQTILFLKLKWNAQCDINIELHSEVIMPAKAAQAHFSSKTIDCTSIWYLYFWFYNHINNQTNKNAFWGCEQIWNPF